MDDNYFNKYFIRLNNINYFLNSLVEDENGNKGIIIKIGLFKTHNFLVLFADKRSKTLYNIKNINKIIKIDYK